MALRRGSALLTALGLLAVWRFQDGFVGSWPKKLSTRSRELRGLRSIFDKGLRRHAEPEDKGMIPVGPFCPFISGSFVNLEGTLEEEHRKNMERIVNRVDELMAGGSPEPQEQLRLGREMREADLKWRSHLLQMRHADDFQTRELLEFSDAHLRHLGISLSDIETFAAWQADVLEAFGCRRPPPPPPVEPSSERARHLQGVLDSIRFGGSGGVTSLTLDMTPPKSLDTPVVQEELQKLEADHAALVDFGQRYGQFDSAGKKIYLDQVEAIEERWRIYFARFRLMGEPEPAYMGEAYELLKKLALSSGLAQKLLSEAHDHMRKQADMT